MIQIEAKGTLSFTLHHRGALSSNIIPHSTEYYVYVIFNRVNVNAGKDWQTAQQEYHIGPEEDKTWNRRYGLTQIGTASLLVAILYSFFEPSLYGLSIALTLNFAVVHNIVDYFHTKAAERAIAAEKAGTKDSIAR